MTLQQNGSSATKLQSQSIQCCNATSKIKINVKICNEQNVHILNEDRPQPGTAGWGALSLPSPAPRVKETLAPCKHTLWVCSSVSVHVHCPIRYALHESPKAVGTFQITKSQNPNDRNLSHLRRCLTLDTLLQLSEYVSSSSEMKNCKVWLRITELIVSSCRVTSLGAARCYHGPE